MSGTRAVVSFFVGMSRVPVGTTALMAFVSSVAWYALLLLGGRELGQNWQAIAVYLDSYGEAMTVIILLIVAAVSIHRWLQPKSPSALKDQHEVNE